MHPKTILTKTAKGVLEVKNRTIRLSRDLGLVFLAVDGRSTVAELPQKTVLDEQVLNQALEKLLADGYLKVFYQPPEPGFDPSAKLDLDLDLDLDFTSPGKLAQISAEAQRSVKAEAAANVQAETAARATAGSRADTRSRSPNTMTRVRWASARCA